MPTPKHSKEEADEYFRNLAASKEQIQAAYLHIIDTISSALPAEDYPLLFSLIPYIEGEEGELAYRFSGKVHRIIRYLRIIQMEYKYQCPLFCDNCEDADSLYDKYLTSLFAMRRLLFRLSPESVEEARAFLQANVLSPFAVYVIASDDLIIPTDDFYRQISRLYRGIWTEREHQFFTAFTASGGNRNESE